MGDTPPSPPALTTRRMVWRCAVAMTIVLVLFSLNFGVNHRQTAELEHFGRHIDTAGRLRLLVSHSGWHVQRIAEMPEADWPAAQRELTQLIASLDNTQRFLLHGDPGQGVPPPPASVQQAARDLAGGPLSTHRQALRAVVVAPRSALASTARRSASEMFDAYPATLGHIESVVTVAERQARDDVAALARWSLSLLVIEVVTLAGVVLLVLSPMIRDVGRATGRLQQSNDELSSNAESLRQAMHELQVHQEDADRRRRAMHNIMDDLGRERARLEREAAARREAEFQLAAHAAQLKSSNEELEKFAYVVSHDVKAPLRGIASVAEWLAEDLADTIDEDTQENIDLMIDRTKRLNRLIDGILTYSRIGRAVVTRSSIDVEKLIGEVIDSIDPPDAIIVRIDGSLPAVEYDETQLRQVFQNLIGNAITHMQRDDGEVVVSGETLEDGTCSYSVRDNGIGIPERHLGRVFELFQTLGSNDTNRSTGAGLTIVKRIIEINGGAIDVESTEGSGTRFSFTIPQTAVPHTAEPSA